MVTTYLLPLANISVGGGGWEGGDLESSFAPIWAEPISFGQSFKKEQQAVFLTTPMLVTKLIF